MFDLQGLNIYLVGMMGAGKSTVGKLLADRLTYGFIDTDTTIEQVVGQKVSDIFQSVGEVEFRQIESQILAEISAYTKLVVATGGGIVVKRENWSHLQQGLVIWLDVPIEVLEQRVAQDTQNERPLKEKLKELLAARHDRYAAADLRIEISPTDTPDPIVDRIIATIPTVLKATASDN
jgi:shikimate kinase